jgi:hypothetical protein
LLTKRQFGRVSVAYHKPFQAMCGANRSPPEGSPQRSNLAVRLQLKVLTLEWELVLLRLQMAPWVSRAIPLVLALPKGAGGALCRSSLRWSLKALSLSLPSKFAELPCLLVGSAAWEKFWVEHPEAWESLLRLVRQRAISEPQRAKAVMDVCPSLAPHTDLAAEEEELKEFLCGQCGLVFLFAGGANVHRARIHGATTIKCYSGTSICLIVAPRWVLCITCDIGRAA